MLSSNPEVEKITHLLSATEFDFDSLRPHLTGAKNRALRNDKRYPLESLAGFFSEVHLRKLLVAHGFPPSFNMSGKEYTFKGTGHIYQKSVKVQRKRPREDMLELDYMTRIGDMTAIFEVKARPNIEHAIYPRRINKLAACLEDVGIDQFVYIVFAPADTVKNATKLQSQFQRKGGIVVPMPYELAQLIHMVNSNINLKIAS